MRKLKIKNPIRFATFCLCVIAMITTACCIHIDKTTKEKIKRTEEISRELEDIQIVSQEELEEIKDVIQEEKEISEDFEEISVNTPKTQNLGVFTVTAYCCCEKCCGKTETHPSYGITASGTKAVEGRTIAVDPKIIPLGRTVYLNGRPYIAEDTGSAIKGNKIDLFINNHQRAQEFGVQEMEVIL